MGQRTSVQWEERLERRAAVMQNAKKTQLNPQNPREYSPLGLREEKPNTTPLPRMFGLSNRTLGWSHPLSKPQFPLL